MVTFPSRIGTISLTICEMITSVSVSISIRFVTCCDECVNRRKEATDDSIIFIEEVPSNFYRYCEINIK